MVNVSIEFEVTISTRYEDSKGNAKCKTWSGLNGSELFKVVGNVIIQCSTLVGMRLCKNKIINTQTDTHC